MIETLVNSLLTKISVLLTIALLADLLMRRRFLLKLATFWNAVLLSIIVLPLGMGLVPKLTLPVLPVDTFHWQQSSYPMSFVMDEGPLTINQVAQQFPPGSNIVAGNITSNVIRFVLPAIYFSAVLLFLIRIRAGFHAINALVSHATPVVSLVWQERLEYWSARLGLLEDHSEVRSDSTERDQKQPTIERSRVRLLTTDRIEVPMAIGVLQSTILIPSKLIPRMTRKNIDAILTHELAHVVRGDFSWQLLQRIVEAALWFHPIFWIVVRRMEFVRERACDEFAVHQLGDLHSYAETLLDIAAGIKKEKSRRLGLAFARPAGLARRLDAMTENGGGGQCIASARFRCAVTGGMLAAAIGMARIDVASVLADDKPAATSAAASGETSSSDPAAESPLINSTEMRSPELIAVTWQQIPESNGRQFDQPVWRPDGTLLTADEAKSLCREAGGFQAHWWNKTEALRPLVFLFRTNPEIGSGIMTRIVLSNEDRASGGTWGYSIKGGLNKSASSPSRHQLSAWPAKIKLEMKVPLERPTKIKTLHSAPDGLADVGPGARWYLDPRKGVNRSNPQKPISGLTAAVLELRYDSMKSLINHSAEVWLKGRDRPLAMGYATIIEPEPGVTASIYVTEPIDDLEMIEKVEFFRQRFRFERIDGVETHLDLMPADPPDVKKP